jgi:glycerophosphoryl diester phosphodiesterase
MSEPVSVTRNGHRTFLKWHCARRRAAFDAVTAVHAAGRGIDAYTIKSADATTLPIVQRLLALKVDQITTTDAKGLDALIEANL